MLQMTTIRNIVQQNSTKREICCDNTRGTSASPPAKFVSCPQGTPCHPNHYRVLQFCSYSHDTFNQSSTNLNFLFLNCSFCFAGKAYKETKHALHSSIPSNLLCRETETKHIETFLKVHLVHRKAGSLYISGAPGTGKTACLTHILENLQVFIDSHD